MSLQFHSILRDIRLTIFPRDDRKGFCFLKFQIKHHVEQIINEYLGRMTRRQ